MASLPREVEKVRKGNDKVVMRLVGEVMKVSKGAADARAAHDLLLQLIRGDQ
jgi:aspartyl-tRNA(Asn)/glutamyl-tRNA(Gln) amidotransferase subunit B